MVEKKTGFALPSGSRGLNLYYSGSEIDPAFVAKIEVPVASGEQFVKQLEQIPIHADWKSVNPLSQRVSWWKPTKTSILIERTFIIGSTAAFVHALVCKEEARWIFYVEWSRG